jgi:polyhydroxybutyrate depolymerase
MRFGISIIVASLVIWGVWGCHNAPRRKDLQPGKTVTKRTDIRLKGLRRNYRLHVPGGYCTGEAVPLLVVIHGAFSTAKDIENVSGFSRLAEEQNFVAVYPNGFGIFGFLQHWNAGHCCGKAKKDGIDDVAFLDAVIADVRRHVSVDERRIYMVGFSNGGMLAYRFAAERSETLAAVAALSAALGGYDKDDEVVWEMPAPVASVPLLIMHGDADDSIPYDGGRSPRHQNQYYLSVREAVDFWVKVNGCDDVPQTAKTHRGQVQESRWVNSDTSTETVLYTLKGWGHDWPGLEFTRDLPASNPLSGFDGTRVIWEFFQGKLR